MDIKFPEQQNPFPKTMAAAVAAAAVALAIGLFLGYCLGSLFGTNQELLNTTNYTDSMAAARTVFIDPDQMDSYVHTAQVFKDMEGLKVYTARNLETTMVRYQGKLQRAEELFDENVIKSLRELMNTQEALYGVTDSVGDPMEDIRVYNIAVMDGVVYYYLYYDEAGFVGIAFDEDGSVLSTQGDTALPLTKTSEGTDGHYQWFITYYFEE